MKTPLLLAALLTLGALATVPSATAETPTMDCYSVYSRTEVGTYSIVRRSSCSPPEVYQCPYEGAPINQCEDLLELRAATSASSPPWGDSTPDVQCMDVYSENQVPGTNYWIVRRDSCSVQLYECPAGYSPPAPPCHEAQLLTASAALPSVGLPPFYCMPYTREFELGPLTVEQGGCGNDVELCDDSVLDREIESWCLTTVVAGASAPAYEPQCMYVYRETTVGPVTNVSRDSCHSETYVCEDADGVHEQDETLQAFLTGQATQPDAAAVQECVSDTLDDYVAWG